MGDRVDFGNHRQGDLPAPYEAQFKLRHQVVYQFETGGPTNG